MSSSIKLPHFPCFELNPSLRAMRWRFSLEMHRWRWQLKQQEASCKGNNQLTDHAKATAARLCKINHQRKNALMDSSISLRGGAGSPRSAFGGRGRGWGQNASGLLLHAARKHLRTDEAHGKTARERREWCLEHKWLMFRQKQVAVPEAWFCAAFPTQPGPPSHLEPGFQHMSLFDLQSCRQS
jgi:hypothetical protein